MEAAAACAFDVVVLEDLDRAFRNEADYHTARERLNFHGVAIHTAGGLLTRIEGSVRAMLAALYLELSLHVRRGLTGVVKDGRSAGGRSYGYRPVAGSPGRLVIDEAEANVVRRIFADYAAGASPREIAHKLNTDGVLGPRGGAWNASTILGSRQRRNGILQNALYDGRIVWNRQRFAKHPDTARRVSRANPEQD
jgi:site-specific DNA recombinase